MDIIFTLQSTSDGTPMTGQASNVTVYLSIDGGNYAASTNAAQEIGRGTYKVTLTSAEAAFQTLLYTPVCTGAQSNIYQRDADPAIPTASDNATAVWSAQTKEVTINSAQADTFATASSVANIATVAGAIKAKTDNLPTSPAAVGSAMTLTEATVLAIRNGLATITATNALAQGLDTLANHGDTYWSTADVSELATRAELSTAESNIVSAIPTADIAAIKAGLYNWELVKDGSTESITAKSGISTVAQSTITRNSAGEIIKMEETE